MDPIKAIFPGLAFSINLVGQSAPLKIKGLSTKPQQSLGQENLFVNCEDTVDKSCFSTYSNIVFNHFVIHLQIQII